MSVQGYQQTAWKTYSAIFLHLLRAGFGGFLHQDTHHHVSLIPPAQLIKPRACLTRFWNDISYFERAFMVSFLKAKPLAVLLTEL